MLFSVSLFDFEWTHAISTHVKSHFWSVFLWKTIYAPLTHRSCPVSKDVEFYCASFDMSSKFVASCTPTETPTRKIKKWIFGSKFPGNPSYLTIFLDYFESSRNSAIQNKSSSLGVENSKILGIQPTYIKFSQKWQFRLEIEKLKISRHSAYT